ncbi:MAG: antitoxin [Actinomycetota bacterium]|nr:antitoxin [Actinomycetota bacterium]
MSILNRRLQVLIDEDRWARLEREASHRGVPVAVLVREAIDQRFPALAEERRAALQAVLDAEPMEVPEPAQLRQELDSIRGHRSA